MEASKKVIGQFFHSSSGFSALGSQVVMKEGMIYHRVRAKPGMREPAKLGLRSRGNRQFPHW